MFFVKTLNFYIEIIDDINAGTLQVGALPQFSGFGRDFRERL